jgi:hypothetical protein
MSPQDHHVIRQQTIKQAVSAAAVKDRTVGKDLSDGERNLLETPLSTVLNDRRNIVRIKSVERHHRAHQGSEPERLSRDELPRLIDEFAADYGLEWALERELELIDNGERVL